jgi:hypothetical protein
MWPHRCAWLILLALVLWPLGPSLPQPMRSSGLMRFSGSDAEPWRRTDEEWQLSSRPRGLQPSPGPCIVVQQPQLMDTDAGPTIELGTPTDLEIRFEATQAPVDMDSLQVRASKWLLTKSLTALLQPYIRGTSIQAHHVQLPAGRFRLEITIADITGAKTTEAYRVEVRGAVVQHSPLRTLGLAWSK